MSKKLFFIAIVVIFLAPIMLHAFNYLSEDDYNKLSSKEKEQYNKDLLAEMTSLQERKNDANTRSDELESENAGLRESNGGLDDEITQLLGSLGYTNQDVAQIHNRIKYYKDQLNNWEKMSDDELWRSAKAFKELSEDYAGTKAHPLAALPEFTRDFRELNQRFSNVQDHINEISKRKGYFEEDYRVQSGDTLSKISGYDFIYGDSSKWGIIYRANRDQLRKGQEPTAGTTIKIPRGLPTAWKVYSGECLWFIAQYPEVYGTGTKWPLIYRANRDKIKDPDLIYPNQVFTIPRDN
jgi:LysM repeat protein